MYYHIRVNGRYAGMIFADRCVLKGDTYSLSTNGLPFLYLERDMGVGIEVVPEPGSKAPAVETAEERTA